MAVRGTIVMVDPLACPPKDESADMIVKDSVVSG